MKVSQAQSAIHTFFLAAGALAVALDTAETGPDDEHSLEHDLDLGITPLAPYGNIQSGDPWATPLVHGCPILCSEAGPDPADWTQIHDQDDLVKCQESLLFDFVVQNDIIETFRACVVAGAAPSPPKAVRRRDVSPITPTLEMIEEAIASSESCGAKEFPITADFSIGPVGVLSSPADAAAAVDSLAQHLQSIKPCGQTIMFFKARSTVVALYVSADIRTGDAVAAILEELRSDVARGSQVIQTCDSDPLNPYTLGLFAVDDLEGLAEAQEAVKTWANGDCVSASSFSSRSIVEMNVLGASQPLTTNPAANSSTSSLTTSSLESRAVCKAIQVVSGDSCASLVTRCGITSANLLAYNTKANFCATLAVKQWVCCSSGTLPVTTPQPQADGTCATYTIGSGDGCWAIGDAHEITTADIETFNKKTWGWAGCDRLQPGQIICLSKGNTPMPAAIAGAVCGPQVPGTAKPSGTFDGIALAKLNQCPLKACCSGWGFCGTTSEFCTESPASTGAPGAFKAGTNGCISNCGTNITNNANAPATFRKIGYFQGYNGARSCLRMDATEIKKEFADLTHVHFAFAGLTADFNVNISDSVKEQFTTFVSMDAPFTKIISFGGWAESTDAATFTRYRDAVKPANRAKFATNVLAFLDKYKSLGGVDFDWEYPGAVDQGITPGTAADATNYLDFLTAMRAKLGTTRSLSVALPASYWYLKPFPVEAMGKVVDYFIYMTYDLHGQWDYGNSYANPSCANGNCLRSHVNKTETTNALSMITKAGVAAEKVIVGVASYGRSFRMADKACTGPNCLFTGSMTSSGAEPGLCTQTGGYISNAELSEISRLAAAGEPGYSAKKWFDASTDSDMMTYGTQGSGMTDWVAYMSNSTKSSRTKWIKGLNFGGTADWAIDLAGWYAGPEAGSGQSNWGLEADHLECDSSDWPSTLDDLSKKIDSLPAQCRAMALMKILVDNLVTAVDDYKMVSKDYDDKFKWYADWVKDQIDERLEDFLALLRGEGLKYMDCEWESNKNSGSGPCTEADPIQTPGSSPGPRMVKFTMRDEEGFYAALLAKTGIRKEWITWVKQDALMDVCPPCPGLPPCPAQIQCSNNYYMRKNWPKRISDKSKIQVDNPKKIIDEAIPSTDQLIGVALGTYAAMRNDVMDAEEADIVTAFSLPIFMLEDATDSIKTIKDIGEEMKKTHTKNLIMGILSIVLLIIPFAGEAAVALGGAAMIARGALIVGEVGNAAMSIVDIVDNPSSAPFAILGMLVGAAGLRGGKAPRGAFKDAADARRALNTDAMAAFSAELRRKDGLVQGIVKACLTR